MAKASKKKLSKKSVKKRAVAAVVEDKPEVAYDDEEREVPEEDVTSEEEEEEENGDERKRQKLVEAIASLGGRQRRSHAGERSEAAASMSEFGVAAAAGPGERVALSELIDTMEETPAVSSRSTKQLKQLQRARRTAESPLSRRQSERIRRDVAFQKAAAEVSRWKGVIRQNQRAEQLVFPLQREPSGPRPVERLACGWRARTPLEREVFSLLTANKQPVDDPVLTPAEEASLRAMSLEEARVRRAELQKARALQSYHEAKSRRERRIKSKKYHKVQNKSKRKELLKRFEELAQTDPAGALEELRRVEVARMQERMSLKHQNSGKWARSKVIMAKYDHAARKAMQEQLEVNKELTVKVANQLDEEEVEEEEEEAVPDFVNDAECGGDPSNPWMRGKLSEEQERSNVAALAAGEEVVTIAAAAAEEEEEEEEQVEETEEEVLLKEFESRRKVRKEKEAEAGPVEEEEDEEEGEEEVMDKKEEEEEEELSKFTHLFRELVDGGQDVQPETNPPAALEEDLRRDRTLEEVELLSQEELTPQTAPSPPPPPPPPPAAGAEATTAPKSSRKRRKRNVELTEVLTKGTQDVQVPLAPTVEDGEDPGEPLDQKRLIREAFAGDDVVSSFLKDKRNQEDSAKPKKVDLTLPGWGEWGGTGLKPSRAKRRRFTVKAPAPPPPRRDHSLPGVIISEQRNAALGLHQVNSLPFPFQNQQQFQSTIRTPLGRAWNTEGTVKKVTQPQVVTRLGTIIPPMAREELLKEKKRAEVGDLGRKKH